MTENLLVSLNDIEEKEASWLVPQRMPKGQIIILAGDGGSGKTSCWCSLAAAISTGAQVFFDETPKEFFESEPQKVLFFSSEDSLEYTLKARLRKAGANFNNIFSVDLKNERFSEIKFNSKLLKELIEQVKPALIVFDPLQAFIPVDMQMGQRNAMRACLSPLIGIGEQYSSKWRFRCCGTIPETTVYKGEVTRMSDLPIEPEIGDVYKVSGKTVFFDGCWNEIASAE